MEIQALAPIGRTFISGTSESQEGPSVSGFARVLDQIVGSASRADAEATAAIEGLATGEATDLHSVVLAVNQADMSFRLALEIRNRLQDALTQILNQPV